MSGKPNIPKNKYQTDQKRCFDKSAEVSVELNLRMKRKNKTDDDRKEINQQVC